MPSNDLDTRRLILETTQSLMEETEDIGKITVRQIAERAGVGVGLINYHFQSKDNLLGLAIGDWMAATIAEHTKPGGGGTASPAERLKALLLALYGVAAQNAKWMRFLLTRELVDGNMETPMYLIPLLKELFGERKDDMQLRIIALQILYPIQVTGLHQKQFQLYSGINLADADGQGRFIDELLGNLM